jgi:Zinc-binding loop region of homing endonuclease
VSIQIISTTAPQALVDGSDSVLIESITNALNELATRQEQAYRSGKASNLILPLRKADRRLALASLIGINPSILDSYRKHWTASSFNANWQQLISKQTQTSDCLFWYGDRDKDGYGLVSAKYKKVKRHRLIRLVMENQLQQNSELQVRHLCGNRGCYNRKHLCVGTAQDNANDRERDGRTARGVRNSRSKISEAQALRIMQNLDEGVSMQAISQLLEVSYGVITGINYRHNWRHLQAA